MDKNHKILLYLGSELLCDVNKIAKNRVLSEELKSEKDSANSDQFTFSVNWTLLKRMLAIRFDEAPESLLRVGKTRVVFLVNDKIRFSGFMATKPARSGFGSDQEIELKFFEHFARLAGDLVTDPNNANNPYRRFQDRPAHLFVTDLIGGFLKNAKAAGEDIDWRAGNIDTLGNKTIEYKDFTTVSKALCDAMNNITGHGQFDVVVRTDEADHSKQIYDVLKNRGRKKNMIIRYPSDGVYKLWSSGYSIEETNDYASNVLIAGNGQLGNTTTGEMTAKIASRANATFSRDYMYWRHYEAQSNLESQNAVNDFAEKRLAQLDFAAVTPSIELVGRPIAWGEADNLDNGLAIGDSFYFSDDNDDGINTSGWMRIIGLETKWDNNGVETVTPTLKRVSDV